MKLLHVDSSILGDGSVSRQLSAAIVDEWRHAVPGLEVVRRDLAAQPVPHLSGALLAAGQPDSQPDAETRASLDLGTTVLDEFLAADVVVIGAPMYNFSVPSSLKAWIDRLAVAGKTFTYSEAGAKGLAGGKKVVIASSRGGIYTPGSPIAGNDFQEPYLRAVFAFFGIEDVEFIRAEGVNYGPEHRERALGNALDAIPARVRASATLTGVAA